MKLYQLWGGDRFRIEGGDDIIFTLSRLDGLYSICYEGKYEEIIHLSVNTPVISLVPKGYTEEKLERDNPHNQWMYE